MRSDCMHLSAVNIFYPSNLDKLGACFCVRSNVEVGKYCDLKWKLTPVHYDFVFNFSKILGVVLISLESRRL